MTLLGAAPDRNVERDTFAMYVEARWVCLWVHSQGEDPALEGLPVPRMGYVCPEWGTCAPNGVRT